MPITTESELRAHYGEVSPVAQAKGITHLDKHCIAFIARSPFLILSTTDGVRLDASPKGDRPGFVRVVDGNLMIPDWPGNRRLDGMRNILTVPRVGTIFMVPNVSETLRVNGKASIHIDKDILEPFEFNGKLPVAVIKVEPEEVFLHCAKAFMRSKLWQADTWPERSVLPSMGEMLKDHAKLDAPPYASVQEMEARLRETLY
ncbi:MAG: pyridoxamine 5'-phosphate oxidase family protein [Burkholderiaceae bacterium]